jgi:hypothetical protein
MALEADFTILLSKAVLDLLPCLISSSEFQRELYLFRPQHIRQGAVMVAANRLLVRDGIDAELHSNQSEALTLACPKVREFEYQLYLQGF